MWKWWTLLPPPRPFETLSQGRRFAMVPLAGGGAFWFATRPLAEGESSAVEFRWEGDWTIACRV